MEFKKPNYIKDIYPPFKKYFSKKYFDGTKPYPPTIQAASKYVLFDILHADEINTITGFIPPQASDDTPEGELNSIEQFELNYPDDYIKGFNFYYWQHLNIEAKIIMLYWFNKDITNELGILPIDFCFLTLLDGLQGCQASNDYIYQILIDPSTLDYDSSYNAINTIAHELNHAQYASIIQKNYMFRMNTDIYWEYEHSNDVFENIYNYLLYYFQPIEITANIYAYKKVCEIFKKGSESNKIPSLTDLVCIDDQKNALLNYNKLRKKIFGDNLIKHIDLYYLLDEIEYELKYKKITKKRAKELMKDIDDTNAEIEKEKAQFKKAYIDYLNKNFVKSKIDEIIN